MAILKRYRFKQNSEGVVSVDIRMTHAENTKEVSETVTPSDNSPIALKN